MTIAVTSIYSPPSIAAQYQTGNRLFSDEQGGFELLGASGSGTPRDPVLLVERLTDIAPATLTVRRIRTNPPRGPGGLLTLTLDLLIANCTRRVWAGFELELQEVLRRPSVYTDGLSFNQFGAQPPDVSSDSFSDNNRLFEPYDRVRFEAGHVDPGAAVRFRVTITDPTPTPTFYMVQDPKILSASLPARIVPAGAAAGASCNP